MPGLGALWRRSGREAACPVGFADTNPWDSVAMAHARRNFFDVHATTKSPLAPEALNPIVARYAIEREVRGSPATGRLFWMTMMRRIAPDAIPKLILTHIEIGLLDRLFSEKTILSATAGTLAAYLTKVAQLGGYLARTKDPISNPQIMWARRRPALSFPPLTL